MKYSSSHRFGQVPADGAPDYVVISHFTGAGKSGAFL